MHSLAQQPDSSIGFQIGCFSEPAGEECLEGPVNGRWTDVCNSQRRRDTLPPMADAPEEDLHALAPDFDAWARSFDPTETTIDGGLFPSRLGQGMLGLEYTSFRLSGRRAELPDIDPAYGEELLRMYGGPIPTKRPL